MRTSQRREWRLAASALALLELAGGRAGNAAETPALAWRSVSAPVRGGEISALAFDAASATLAIGDVRGVLVGPPEGAFERRLRRGPVRDLAFLGGANAGSLLAATARGLFLLEPGGAVAEVSPGPGPAARAANRLAVAAGWVAAATDDGVFFSRDARRWQRPATGFPAGAATALALREREGALECWAVVAGEPWSAQLVAAGEDLTAREIRRQTVSFGAANGGPVDLVLAPEGADVVMVYPTALALRERDGALECWAVVAGEPWSAQLVAAGEELTAREIRRQTVSFGAANGGPVDLVLAPAGADVVMVYPTALALRDARSDTWRSVRLELPPGAEALRFRAGAGHLFLATLRGLLVAETLEGPWRRAEPPAGSAAVRALAGDTGVLFAAADTGLLAGSEPAPRAAAVDTGERRLELPEEPSIEQVHRAALAYSRLGLGRMDALRRGVSTRGWLPVVALRGGYAHDENRGAKRDQTVSSGAIWHLEDRDRDHGQGYDVSLSIAWDLGDIAYHPEAIDVSHEAREVIELRDDVLDEITQLYFERRRVLAQLQALPDRGDAEAFRLRLRADELAAGIDAWTGGWFGHQTHSFAAQTVSSPRAGGN